MHMDALQSHSVLVRSFIYSLVTLIHNELFCSFIGFASFAELSYSAKLQVSDVILQQVCWIPFFRFGKDIQSLL